MDVAQDIDNALKVLKEGGIILYPTDTVWGLGCDATNEEAVKRIFAIKQRSCAKAMISLVDSLETLKIWLDKIPHLALEEIKNNRSRPLTIIYDTPRGIVSLLRAEDGSAAFRITGHFFSHKLCAGLGRPLVSTSANISGQPTPKRFDDIDAEIIDSLDYVCNTGRIPKDGHPSRILKITDKEEITIVRE